ncbi:MAG TPA: hypothetical protein VGJ82_09960 [Thermoanaerobaculia bacterium]|jgi:hypothetical protein
MLPALFLAATLSTAPIPLDAARRTFDDVRIASDEDGGRLWGRPLYGPILFVDPQTRYVVANQQDSSGVLKPAGAGVFDGTLPKDVVIANTATDWSGTHWTMVMWGAVSPVSVGRRRLVLHECFHRIQNDLGLPAANASNPHLDSLDGRYWYLLELRALSAALKDEKGRTQAVADALAFRAKRRSLFADAAANERALEANEGVAEYTGFALRGTGPEETRLAVARRLDATDRGESFVRSFAYSTGPAYGLLLDVANPAWRSGFHKDSDFADLLGAALKVTPTAGAVSRAAAYGGATLRAEEEKRAKEQAEKVARYRARLVDGPVIEVSLDAAQYGFDPYAVIALGDDGTVYPTLEASGAWGTIATESGARADLKRNVLIFGAEDRAKLKLNAGWELRAAKRAGDFVIEKSSQQ